MTLAGYGVTWNMGSKVFRKPMACGHHESLRVKSVESDYEYCELCEVHAQRRDALAMEHHYRGVAEDFEVALRSIANSACCLGCQEAALVAKVALRSKRQFTG